MASIRGGITSKLATLHAAGRSVINLITLPGQGIRNAIPIHNEIQFVLVDMPIPEPQQEQRLYQC